MSAQRVFRRFGAAFVIALAASAPATAAEPTDANVKAAREVIEASGAATGLKDIVPIFLDEAKRTFTRTRPEVAKDIDEVLRALLPEFEQRREELLTEIARAYAQKFSAQELADIKTFYATPTGRKLVEQLPSLLQTSYERTNAWSQRMSQDVISRMRAEMKKRGKDI